MSKYEKRGVSANKQDVHRAIKNLSKGVFPNAFCKFIPDHLTGDPNYVLAMHADGAGTKSSLAYAYWKKTGDLSVWKGIAQDALVMNIDDLMCSGVCEHLIFSSTIGRNKKLIPGEIIKALIEGSEELVSECRDLGLDIHTAGGETADVGDLVRTIIVDSTITGRVHKDVVIKNEIEPGAVIVGLASEGQASYEGKYNSGMGSNGLTFARHEIFSKGVGKEFPETFDRANLPKDLAYSGNFGLTDLMEGLPMNAGEALLSPTRTYFPIIKEVLRLHRKEIQGIIHCTGGGQTKVLHFARGLHIVKDKLRSTPVLFKTIQSQSDLDWREMYEVFNMGHRMEIYTDPATAERIISISESFGVEAKVIGYTQPSDSNKLTIDSEHGIFEY